MPTRPQIWLVCVRVRVRTCVCLCVASLRASYRVVTDERAGPRRGRIVPRRCLRRRCCLARLSVALLGLLLLGRGS